jgi:nucleotide-binding universal stress UspA family protein
MLVPKVIVKKILFATDLSEDARLALAYAVNLSKLYGAGITILHVLESSPGMSAAAMYHVGPELWAAIRKQQEESARKALIGKQRRESPDFKQALTGYLKNLADDFEERQFVLDEVVVKRGNPVDRIIETAQEKQCDLIVMGTQGVGRLARVVIGSTAQKVLRRSTIPVLVVRFCDRS